MQEVSINIAKVGNLRSFLDLSKELFGFPDFYSSNQDAWIDCMSSLRDQSFGNTKFVLKETDFLVINLQKESNHSKNQNDLLASIIELIDIVNDRVTARGETSLLKYRLT